ncbi:MAG: hypothetical protein LQ341_000592 [Variospora aurantia]|nr:MAG: hypothetical protein LQ341_000592 [Variospora aurantia]
MADSLQQLDEDNGITPQQSSTLCLQYPSISVRGTPESWLCNSLLVPMASNQDDVSVRSNDDTMSFLGDSAYDFVDDASLATTDDEDQSRMTDSASVAREGSPGEAEDSDLERTLSAEGVTSPKSEDAAQAGPQELVASATAEPEGPAFESSLRTRRGQHQYRESRANAESIRFHEIRHGEGIKYLHLPSIPQQLAATVRHHMLDLQLSTNGPYKLLYSGDTAGREGVINKIGAALASTARFDSSGPTRYNVVPMPSSDETADPNDPVILDWSGHGMAVYQCVDASFHRSDCGHDTIDIILDGDAHIRSFWDGSKFSVTGDWETPDIAIFYLSDNDNVSARQTRRFARSFMARHNVPSIVISERPSWDRPSETMMIDHHTPHICLQTRNDSATSPRVVKRLPIDLSTFSNLDARQLNQNLAYLAMAHDAPGSTDEKTNKLRGRHSKSLRSKLKSWCLDYHIAMPPTKLPYLRNILAAAGMFLLLSFAVPHLFSFSSRSIASGPIPYTGDSCSHSSSMATSKALLQDKPTVMRNVVAPSTQSTALIKSHTGLATQLTESSSMTVSKSEKFQVHVLGNGHVILKPPYWLTKLRRTPTLNFSVTQGNRVLQHDVSALFDGVYAIKLLKDDAHALVNITVWTASKPKIYEILQADFGGSWLRVAGWKIAAKTLRNSFRRDLTLMQTSTSAVWVELSAEIHSFVKNVLVKTQDLRNETQVIGRASIDRMLHMRALMQAVPKRTRFTLVQFLELKKSSAANEIRMHVAQVRRNVSSYLSNRMHIARSYAHAAPTMYRIHLRNSQKGALKMWWSLVGSPMQRPVNISGQGNSRASCNGKRKGQFLHK